jgi:hypothetical protein
MGTLASTEVSTDGINRSKNTSAPQPKNGEVNPQFRAKKTNLPRSLGLTDGGVTETLLNLHSAINPNQAAMITGRVDWQATDDDVTFVNRF